MARWGIRPLVVAAVIGATFAVGTMAAFAVSDGNYSPERQHCTSGANDTVKEDEAEAGCHSMTVVVEDGTGHEYTGVGTDQTPGGQSVHSGSAWVDPGSGDRTDVPFDETGVGEPTSSPSTPADPSTGLHVYFGADDNLDNGEHDGSSQISNGPSDGGAIQANADPAAIQDWAAAVQADPTYAFLHPIPGADAGMGACADGVCFTVQSERRVVFTGDDPCEDTDLAANGETLEECQARTADTPDRQVTDYDGHQWDPDTCGGPDDTAEACGGQEFEAWNEQEGDVYADPGVSVYEDPDAQGSPIGPYPLPAVYAGTCGVVAGSGPVQAPPSPVTNTAGQVEADNPACG